MVVAIEILFPPLSIHISFVLLPHLIIHSVRVYGMRYEKPFRVSFSFLPKGGGGGGGTMWNIGGGGGKVRNIGGVKSHLGFLSAFFPRGGGGGGGGGVNKTMWNIGGGGGK